MQSIDQFTTDMDLLAPLQVRVEFLPIERPTSSFDGGDPVSLIDYRTIPIFLPEGETVASVSEP